MGKLLIRSTSEIAKCLFVLTARNRDGKVSPERAFQLKAPILIGNGLMPSTHCPFRPCGAAGNIRDGHLRARERSPSVSRDGAAIEMSWDSRRWRDR